MNYRDSKTRHPYSEFTLWANLNWEQTTWFLLTYLRTYFTYWLHEAESFLRS